MGLNIIVVLCTLFSVLYAHRYGADLQACDTMKPGHGGTVRRTTRSPYVVETNNLGYRPCPTTTTAGIQNCGIIVRVRSRNGQPFKGFLLQARSKMPGGQLMYVGEFRYMNGQPVTARNNNFRGQGFAQGQFGGPMNMGQIGGPTALGQVQFNPRLAGQGNNVVVQRLMCPRGATVTHTENNPKTMVTLMWYPPANFNRPIMFKATVVQDFNTYWMGHSSRYINARLNLPTASAMTGRWFSSATRASSGVVMFITALVALFIAL